MHDHRDPTPPIDWLPHEIISYILDLLGDEDFCAARHAHRVFWACNALRSLQRRKNQRWLRTSPERAAALGRIDVLEFLRRHKRIPRTFNLWSQVERDDNPDLVRLALAWDPTPERIEATFSAATARGHVETVALLSEIAEPPTAVLVCDVDAALGRGHNGVARFLYEVASEADRRKWIGHAARRSCIGVLRFLATDLPRVPLALIAKASARHGCSRGLDLVQEIDPSLAWAHVLPYATKDRDVTIAYCAYAYHDAAERFDLQAPLVEAALHGRAATVSVLGRWRRSPLSLQPALDVVGAQPGYAMADTLNAIGDLDALYRQTHDAIAPLNFQPALLRAAEKGDVGAVAYMCATVSGLDLQEALEATSCEAVARQLLDASRLDVGRAIHRMSERVPRPDAVLSWLASYGRP
ncbi:hypothetical protein pqer_cds_529 [Pandoravirus quercus]|uniref:Ankyrin repeat domain containing protein n=1 Tax=Pandoravirus quercus TaxID=2107709 RepID=A0A2U7U929_9VIRU|nr:hypothetical protein pqer_cds_529 [Pandoravirus quercus]AVK74951.1 hypothetical protein pqer_cds_529 [Pandoravirus quercus]